MKILDSQNMCTSPHPAMTQLSKEREISLFLFVQGNLLIIVRSSRSKNKKVWDQFFASDLFSGVGGN